MKILFLCFIIWNSDQFITQIKCHWYKQSCLGSYEELMHIFGLLGRTDIDSNRKNTCPFNVFIWQNRPDGFKKSVCYLIKIDEE